VLASPVDVPEGATYTEQADLVATAFESDGWEPLDAASPEFGQASSAAATFIEEVGAFEAGEFTTTAVYDIGGERSPKIGDSIDFIAFRHDPRYVVVEVAAIEPTRSEAGRAPASAVIDESRQRQYVYMVRDLGARRQPALTLAVGGGIIFLALCWLLHRREATVKRNLSAPAPAS
jgi:hypothetical protein